MLKGPPRDLESSPDLQISPRGEREGRENLRCIALEGFQTLDGGRVQPGARPGPTPEVSGLGFRASGLGLRV